MRIDARALLVIPFLLAVWLIGQLPLASTTQLVEVLKHVLTDARESFSWEKSAIAFAPAAVVLSLIALYLIESEGKRLLLKIGFIQVSHEKSRQKAIKRGFCYTTLAPCLSCQHETVHALRTSRLGDFICTYVCMECEAETAGAADAKDIEYNGSRYRGQHQDGYNENLTQENERKQKEEQRKATQQARPLAQEKEEGEKREAEERKKEADRRREQMEREAQMRFIPARSKLADIKADKPASTRPICLTPREIEILSLVIELEEKALVIFELQDERVTESFLTTAANFAKGITTDNGLTYSEITSCLSAIQQSNYSELITNYPNLVYRMRTTITTHQIRLTQYRQGDSTNLSEIPPP